VATDFSEHGNRAIPAALDFAAKDGTVDLLHCYQLPPMIGAAYAPIKAAEDLYKPLRESLHKAAEEAGAELVAKYEDRGTKLRFEAIEAQAIKGVHERLEEGDYDLVVTGSHGRRGVRRFLLGSVSEATVRHAPCTALVVHAPVEDEDEGGAED
jgi:nucleotide-binding universal stress UspA family protein